MKKKHFLLILLCVIGIIQLYVPVRLIIDTGNILKVGKEYKFKMSPIDPVDPFKGKYINLYFNYGNNLHVDDIKKWHRNEIVFVAFTTDKNGFAVVNGVQTAKPVISKFYLKTKINYLNTASKEVVISYPFDKFYMEDSKAEKAEKLNFRNNSGNELYVSVFIYEGNYAIKNVYINNIPISEFIGRNKHES